MYAIPGDLLTCISTDARETTSATAAGMRSLGSRNMRLLSGGDCDRSGDDDASGRGTGADPPYSCRI